MIITEILERFEEANNRGATFAELLKLTGWTAKRLRLELDEANVRCEYAMLPFTFERFCSSRLGRVRSQTLVYVAG